MDHRLSWSLTALVLLSSAGCSGSSSSEPSQAAAQGADPAAQVAHGFLDAVVKGDTQAAIKLLTPMARERIAASGKPFNLLGLENYTFRVGEVGHPSADRAFVRCLGNDRTADGETIEEEFCWLLSLVDEQWRVSGISYIAGPQQTLMIYSFEEPERGAVPVQQLAAQADQSPSTTPTSPAATRPSPRTAQKNTPAAAHR